MASLKARKPFKAQALFAGYALRLIAPRIIAVTTITLLGGALFRSRAPQTAKDFWHGCFWVYAQLFFEHPEPFPADPVLRAGYFVIPLLGAIVVAEGLLRVGASFVDFRNHREAWVRIMAKTLENHVILIGLGNVGYRTLEELMSRGRDVVVIEAKTSGHFVEEARARGVALLTGDARRETLMIEAGIERASAVIAATDNDLVNLEVCVDARKRNPDVRLVMRMFDQSLAQKIGKAFELESTFSTSALSAPLFAAAALDRRVHGAYRLGDSLMVTVELELDRGLEGSTVAAVEERLGAPVVGIVRPGRTASHRFVRTETLGRGDRVVCHVPSEELEDVQRKAQAEP